MQCKLSLSFTQFPLLFSHMNQASELKDYQDRRICIQSHEGIQTPLHVLNGVFFPRFPAKLQTISSCVLSHLLRFWITLTIPLFVPSPSLSSIAATAQTHMVAHVGPIVYVFRWEAPSCAGINK